MDWPSPQGTMIKNFGWNDGGQPQLGILFNTDGSVTAAEGGELLFFHNDDENISASRLPSPLGSFTALDHGDGIISIYSRYENRNNIPASRQVYRGESIGEAGISGWSSSKGFYFQLFDRKERRWINPMMIISPHENIRPPVIVSVTLKDSQGNMINPAEAKSIKQGRYTVYVDVNSGTPAVPLAPYRIICSLNGSESDALNFETYSSRNGSQVVYRNGLIPVQRVYALAPAYEAAEVSFTRGQATLEIITQNITGGVRNAIFRLNVE